jgi:hypothetical protein
LVGTLFGSVGLLMWLASFSGMLVVVVTESSDGHNRVHNWPPANFMESMPELLCVLVAAVASAAPGFAIGQMVTSVAWQKVLSTVGSFWLLFPFVLLSQLVASSPWAMLSGPLFGTGLRRPFSSLLFYCESALLFCVGLALIVATAPMRPSLPVLFAPIYVAELFLYGRLIGRWGLTHAEVAQAKETDEA